MNVTYACFDSIIIIQGHSFDNLFDYSANNLGTLITIDVSFLENKVKKLVSRLFCGRKVIKQIFRVLTQSLWRSIDLQIYQAQKKELRDSLFKISCEEMVFSQLRLQFSSKDFFQRASTEIFKLKLQRETDQLKLNNFDFKLQIQIQ